LREFDLTLLLSSPLRISLHVVEISAFTIRLTRGALPTLSK
jgi:hypothetical protein